MRDVYILICFDRCLTLEKLTSIKDVRFKHFPDRIKFWPILIQLDNFCFYSWMGYCS